MPNHVTNVIEFYCDPEKVAEIKKFMTNEADDRKFDFNKLIPMPEHIFRGDLGPDERKKYGADNWYDWSVEHWGTKWNAYEVWWGDDVVEFNTAWSSVPKIVRALSKRFPDVKMDYQLADEDIGYNVGSITGIVAGNLDGASEFIPDGGSKAAFDLALSVMNAEPEDYCLRWNAKSGTYEYAED